MFSQLYNRQPDGTLTTWLMPRESLEGQWDRPTPFADLLEAAKSVRLLREDELRIEGGEPRRYVRLGHDALAKVAAAWQAEREQKQRLEQERAKRRKQRRQLLAGSLVAAFLAVVFGVMWRKADLDAKEAEHQARLAKDAEVKAKAQELIALKALAEAKQQKQIAQVRLMRDNFPRSISFGEPSQRRVWPCCSIRQTSLRGRTVTSPGATISSAAIGFGSSRSTWAR